jgi:hypothetical protein
MQTKICTKCNIKKKIDRFDKKSKSKNGYNPSCKDCCRLYRQANKDKISVRKRKKLIADPRSPLLASAKRRAKKENLPFNLALEDIYIPKYCPYINIPLAVGEGGVSPNSPSLDRIDPNLGYIKGNVITVSFKANSMKQNATPQEIISLGRNLKNITDNHYPLTPEHIKKISPQPYTPPPLNHREGE